MSRPRNPIPHYRKHPTRNEARCWVGGRWIGLGPWNSPESRAEHERICAELKVAPPQVVAENFKEQLTVSEVLLQFTKWAAKHYRHPDGSQTGELKEFEAAFGPLRELYGESAAEKFGPLALQAYRQRLIDKKWCRTRINKQVGRIRRVFKWAAAQEIVPPSVPQGLACVQGLQRGRTEARESDRVQPVSLADVLATLPRLSRQVRTMVELQFHTGMRPGEVCGLTLEQLDRTGDVWLYRPEKHKTAHHGRERVIPFGPRAKAVFLAFLGDRIPEPTKILFSPAEARQEAYAAMRAKRKTKVQPSQISRAKANPARRPRERYSGSAYANAVADGAERAGVPHWHPNQLRHSFATEVRKTFGLEAAQVLLGHSRADVTQVYAEKNEAMATAIAAKIG